MIMVRKRIEMRQIREILRLRHNMNLSYDQISRALRISKRTIEQYIDRANRVGINWPIPEGMEDDQLELLLFPVNKSQQNDHAGEIDFKKIQEELSNRKYHVSLLLLWNEYIIEHPNGYSYPHFCMLYREFKKSNRVFMHQHHEPGEKMFVDFAGDTVPIYCSDTGEVIEALIFVATLGYSNYTYVEAMYRQDLRSVINAVVNSLKYFKGSPKVIVPDNMKTAVTKSCRYEPEIARPFEELAAHYQIAVIPTRVRRPKDKSKVENEVGHTERSILAPLRNFKFFSVQELNKEIARLLEIINTTPFQKRPESRKDLFEREEKDTLQPLPVSHYEYATWKTVKVHPDCHISFENHYYSVPSKYVGQILDLRSTLHLVEIFKDSSRVASHQRSSIYGYTTVVDHLPESQKVYRAQQKPEYYTERAKTIGPFTEKLINQVMEKKQHKEQSFRTCLGMLSLEKGYGKERLESAAKRALYYNAFTYKSLKSILKTGLDKEKLPDTPADSAESMVHENIRGEEYYNI